MSIIKQTINLKSVVITGTTFINDANIKISLGNNDNFIGFQQEIDNLTSFTTNELINSATDEERRRYKTVSSPTTPTITFWFYENTFSPQYNNNFAYAGFTTDEYLKNVNSYLNSFFILDLYDTYDINTQQKIFTTYLTKKGTTTSTYNISTSANQLYYWYIPESYINGNTGTTTVYAKFMFYNAKTGKVVTFYNDDNKNSSKSDKIHFEVELNHVDKTWRFISPNYPTIWAYELNNAQFNQKVNNTVENMSNLQQVYPSGNTLTYSNSGAGYVTI